MKSLLESSEIFEASSRLQAAATTLHKIFQGEDLTQHDRDNLHWCGQFLEEVDWGSHESNSVGGGNLTVQATEVRPSFYATLSNTRRVFEEAGIQDPNELRRFLSTTYQFLVSRGENAGDQSLNIQLAATFLERLATELLQRLTGNGVPLEKNRLVFAA